MFILGIVSCRVVSFCAGFYRGLPIFRRNPVHKGLGSLSSRWYRVRRAVRSPGLQSLYWNLYFFIRCTVRRRLYFFTGVIFLLLEGVMVKIYSLYSMNIHEALLRMQFWCYPSLNHVCEDPEFA